MKMVVAIVPEARREELRALIAKHNVHSYSEADNIYGEGATGKHFDTRVWPGKSIMVFAVLPRDRKENLLAALREYGKTLYPSEGLRAFVLPVEEIV